MASPMEFEYMEWVIVDMDNWHLKEDSPPEVVKAFEKWEKAIDMSIEE